MSLLKNLRPVTIKLKLTGGPAEVWGLSIGVILDLIERNPDLVSAFHAPPGPDRVAAIVSAIRACGPSVVGDVIDAGTRSEPGTALAASEDRVLVLVDEIELLVAIVRATAPEGRAGKLMAEGEQWLSALGLVKAE